MDVARENSGTKWLDNVPEQSQTTTTACKKRGIWKLGRGGACLAGRTGVEQF